jgi:hypothetical protein
LMVALLMVALLMMALLMMARMHNLHSVPRTNSP